MRLEKACYCNQCIGPGGRDCACCAPPPRELKRLERRKARRGERAMVVRELSDGADS